MSIAELRPSQTSPNGGETGRRSRDVAHESFDVTERDSWGRSKPLITSYCHRGKQPGYMNGFQAFTQRRVVTVGPNIDDEWQIPPDQEGSEQPERFHCADKVLRWRFPPQLYIEKKVSPSVCMLTTTGAAGLSLESPTMKTLIFGRKIGRWRCGAGRACTAIWPVTCHSAHDIEPHGSSSVACRSVAVPIQNVVQTLSLRQFWRLAETVECEIRWLALGVNSA